MTRRGSLTGTNSTALNRGRPVDLAAKRAAIEKALRYLERFLNEERVFRDLFFALAD